MKIRGFLTNLGKYNEGKLVGEWVDFPIDDNELADVFKRIGIDGKKYEEYFFTDWDGYDLGEYISIEDVNEYAERLENADEDVIDALMYALGDLDESLDAYETDDYIYWHGRSMRDVAEELADEYLESQLDTDILDFVMLHFDYDDYADTLECENYYTTDNGVIQVYL